MKSLDLKEKRHLRRKRHIKKEVFGDEERLRLSVYRSLNNIYAQIINDIEGKTLVSASSLEKDIADQFKPDMKKSDKSKIVGINLAKRALEKNIKNVAFDRNGFLYHGRIKALADGAREGGLSF